MISKLELMRRILDEPDYAEKLKSLLLNKNNRDFVNSLRKHTGSIKHVTSHQIATRDNTSTQSASAKLRKLYEKGYLGRKELIDSTGGTYYEYFPIISHR